MDLYERERRNILSQDIRPHLSCNRFDIDKLQMEIKQSTHQTHTDAFASLN